MNVSKYIGKICEIGGWRYYALLIYVYWLVFCAWLQREVTC
jgi:hypothetical protein